MTDLTEQLEGLMRQQLQALDAFHAALEREHEALKLRDFSVLESAVTSKVDRLEVVDTLGRELLALLKQHGYAADRGGLDACIDTPLLRDLWAQVQQGLERCNHRNRVNGGIIQVSRSYTERLLDILRGGRQPSLYGAKGTLRSGDNLSSIAKA